MTTPDPYRPGQPYPAPQPGPFPVPGQPGQFYPQQVPQAGQPYPQQPQYPQPAYPQQPMQYPGQQFPQPAYPQQPQYPQPAYPQQPAFPQPASAFPQYPQPVPQQQFPQPGYGQQPHFPQAAAPQAFSGFPSQPSSAFGSPVPVNPAPQPFPAPVSPAASPIPISARQVVNTPVAPAAAPIPAPAPAAAPKPVTRPAAAPATNAGATATTAAPVNRPMPLGSRPMPVKSDAKKNTAVRQATEEEKAEEEDKKLEKVATKQAPPWLVSLVVHLIVVIAMALIYYALPSSDVVVIESLPPDVWAEDLGEQLQEDVLQSPISMEMDIKDPALSLDSNPVDNPFAAPPELQMVDILNANTSTSDIQAPSIGLALSGREKGAKTALLAAYGGNKTTEESVRKGLLWLKKQQRPDGTWSLMGPYPSPATVENVCSATSMALLAFQGHGDTHQEGEFKDVVKKGWDAMLKMQDADGNFVRDSALHQHLYAQAQATIAVCEIYGMTKDEKFKGPAQKALDYAMNAQAPQGGWRYEPKIDSDTSVTGWFVMALQSGLMAGLEVASPNLEKINQFLDSVQREGGAKYSYQPGREETVVMTAEGLLCRMYLGWKHDDERLKRGVQYLLVNPVNYSDENAYYWYYATQVLHHMEGEEWKQWNAIMRQEIPTHQIKSGADEGSWSPSNDRWGTRAGRLYQTCLSIYMLEVYYRHMPLYAQNYKPLMATPK